MIMLFCPNRYVRGEVRILTYTYFVSAIEYYIRTDYGTSAYFNLNADLVFPNLRICTHYLLCSYNRLAYNIVLECIEKVMMKLSYSKTWITHSSTLLLKTVYYYYSLSQPLFRIILEDDSECFLF